MNGLRARRDAGFTLVEMLVVMMLMAVVGSILTSLMIGSMKTSQRQQDQTATLNAAKVAMERMTREVRGANSMTDAQPRLVRFVTTADGVRTTTTLAVVEVAGGTEIRQTDVERTLNTGDEETTVRTVLGGLAMGRSEAVFTYTDADGQDLPATGVVPNLVYPAGDVRTIGIRVVMKRQFGAPPMELYQLVSIRNLED